MQLLVPLFPGCIPVKQQNWDTAMGHFLCLGSPAQGPPLAPSASPLPPCTQAVHATVLGSVWNPVYEQSNRRFLFFLPFHLLLPQSKAAAASHGLVLRQWWQPGCSCSQPQGAEFQLLARDPPSDLLTACLQFSPSPHLSGLSAPLLSQLSHRGVLAGRMEPSWGFLRRLQFQTQCRNCSPRSFVSHQCPH